MLGFGPTSSAAISAIPDFFTNALGTTFLGTVTWEAVAYSPYRALLNSGGRRVYTMELNVRAVR